MLTHSSNPKEGEIHSLLLRHAVADPVGAVAHELGRGGGALAVDGLGPAALGRVCGVLGRGEAEDVGPLLELLVICCCFFVRNYFPLSLMILFSNLTYIGGWVRLGETLGKKKTHSWGIVGCCRMCRGSYIQSSSLVVTSV